MTSPLEREWGSILAKLHSVDEKLPSLRAKIRRWRDEDLAAAWQYGDASELARVDRVPNVVETDSTLELKSLTEYRLEVMSDCRQKWLVIVNNGRWWRRDEFGHVEHYEGKEESPALRDWAYCHFQPEKIRTNLNELSIQPVMIDNIAGRPCVKVRANTRPSSTGFLYGLPYSTHTHEIWIDIERAWVLGSACLWDECIVESVRIESIELEQCFDGSNFTYVPQPDEQIIQVHKSSGVVSIEEAAELAPFSVFRPGWLPDGHHPLSISYYPASVIDDTMGRVMSCYTWDTGESLWIIQGPDQWPHGDTRFETVTYEGRDFCVSESKPNSETRSVKLEFGGTIVTLYSGLKLEQLFRIATSLVEISKSP
jgi:hypothetical protein